MSKRIYALDFDGVLCVHPPNIEWKEILTYPPSAECVKVLRYLSDYVDFYILTSRKETAEIKQWCLLYGLPDMEVTNYKKDATAYIDDRGIRFTNWADVSKLIL